MLLIVIVLFISGIFVIKAVTPRWRGKAGENRVSMILSSLPREYYVINNVTVPMQRGTSQIDHVVVSPYGIFVIETKNYTGFISGSEKSEDWQENFGRRRKYTFRNPIKQNWGHIYALSSYLGLSRAVFKPIVVFSNHASLHIDTTYVPVLTMAHLRSFILNYNQEIIPFTQVEQIYERISQANLTGTEAGDHHVQFVKETIAQKEDALRQGLCPRCGGSLILRRGKYGSFYGCSNYPKCKFTYNRR